MTVGVKSSLFYILRHRKPELTEAHNKNLGAGAAIVVMMMVVMAVVAVVVVGITIIISLNYLSS